MKFPKLSVSKPKIEQLDFSRGVRMDGKASQGQLSEMKNLQVNEGELSLRPSLEFCSERIYWGDYKFFTIDGRYFGISAHGDVNLACFNENGVLKNIVNIPANTNNAVALVDRDEAVIYYVGKDGTPFAAKVRNYMGDEIELEGHIPIEQVAYTPTVSVSGTGYTYENEDGIQSFDYNGKRYEGKNIIGTKYKVTQTTNHGKNIYVLPYPLGFDAYVKAVYNDNTGMSYEFEILTNEEGGFGYPDAYDDGISLSVFRDDRRTLSFINWESGTFSKEFSPRGNSDCNGFILEITESNPSDVICFCNRSTVFRARDGVTTWIVYGSSLNPSRLWLTGNSDIYYFPESGVADVGTDNDPITAVVQVDDNVAVLKKGSLWLGEIEVGKKYSRSELIGGLTDGDVGETASFSSRKIADIGCDCPETAINCNGRLVWLNSDGVVRMMTAVINPRRDDVRVLSYSVEPIIKSHSVEEMKAAYATFCDGKYYLLIGNDLLVLDCMSNAMYNYTMYDDDLVAQKNLRWLRWDVAHEGIKWLAIRGDKKLYLYGHKGEENIISCTLTGSSGEDATGRRTLEPIEWSAKTGTISFGNSDRQKLSAKLSASVTAENEVTAAILNERGIGGEKKIKPSETEHDFTIVNGERGNSFYAEFSGKGRVKIDKVSLSCRKK
ncbi:MAG: hypothetical protein IIW73_03520 [Clostridia bacterium]|nr:hypothetical protein [Clostridia bacterium]